MVLPRGSQLQRQGFTLPERNGGKSLYLGEQAVVQGGYTEISNVPEDELRDVRCEGEAFVVNRADN